MRTSALISILWLAAAAHATHEPGEIQTRYLTSPEHIWFDRENQIRTKPLKGRLAPLQMAITRQGVLRNLYLDWRPKPPDSPLTSAIFDIRYITRDSVWIIADSPGHGRSGDHQAIFWDLRRDSISVRWGDSFAFAPGQHLLAYTVSEDGVRVHCNGYQLYPRFRRADRLSVDATPDSKGDFVKPEVTEQVYAEAARFAEHPRWVNKTTLEFTVNEAALEFPLSEPGGFTRWRVTVSGLSLLNLKRAEQSLGTGKVSNDSPLFLGLSPEVIRMGPITVTREGVLASD